MYQSETIRWQNEGKNNLMCPRAVKGVRCEVRWSHVDWRLMRATFRMAESPLTLLETYCNSFPMRSALERAEPNAMLVHGRGAVRNRGGHVPLHACQETETGRVPAGGRLRAPGIG